MNTNKVLYKVIEENRVVVATIRGIEHDAINAFNDKFLPHATSNLYVGSYYDQKFMMPSSLKAVARCHPDDVFDIAKGKEVALKRLTEKYNHSLDRHLCHIYNAMNKCLDNMAIYLKAHKVM